ncbi:deoxyribodipyrimidine photo-lyase [Brevundimonas naejangsanensis]|uniref:Deoxyribodipyrimidine photo-lyase n=2 Tax=Brevundimonas naejangsanensis TaxID=588932 RepID=A0A494RIN2_9CAUL|nr:deoxyribodipyrimidine photo-lyase [Brevundimonas naejangsanensis]AYG96318.1 deoxyribodipyrimidine photo-lyase [Brevundimonas naejangsanensis]
MRPVILWFRRDLRLGDNPALAAAIDTGRPILPVYILDEGGEGRRPGAASRWWLDKSLRALDVALRRRGGRLILRRGDSEAELRRLIDQTGADQVFMNRRFEPEAFIRDADIAHALKAEGIACHGFNGSLLARPGAVLTGAGKPYRVFTPFLKALLQAAPDRLATPAPETLATPEGLAGEDIDAWGLHPTAPDWSQGFDWTPGEAGAAAALSAFIEGGLADYAVGRDVPGRRGTSRLSPHLHWGEISPRSVVRAVRAAAAQGRVAPAQADKFVAEIGWREFSAHLLHQFPYMAERAFRPEFDAMPWRTDPEGLAAWKKGRTGYPLVDAGMRELWATGWMHNRVRMVAASFLVKHLLIDWREGEAWFWDTLVDADLASNVQNWQWVAGSGADAAPYFRIFNPVAQGEKFDPAGRYVRRWVPELRALPGRWLHAPWTAPAAVQAEAGVRLGRTYPRPIVDHAAARARALDALKAIAARSLDEEAL